MEVKPGYKQTDVGVIPEEWDSEPCGKLCVKIQDGTHFSPTIRGNDYLYLTSKNVRFGYLDVSTANRIDAAQHEAIYNPREGRIEMHLESVRNQEVRVVGRRIRFRAGERIHTENSYKYSVSQFQELARSANWQPHRVWTDQDNLFSVHELVSL